MRFLFVACLLASAAAQTFNPFAPNGSGCVSNGNPSYCNAASPVLSTDPANTNAQTRVVVPAPHQYSTLDLHQYLYSGATTRVLMHWQPWFCNTGTTCNSHINVGYNENQTATVTAQLAAMKALGVDAVVPDYYGNSASKAFNLVSVNAMAAVIAANPSNNPKMLLGMDAGAFSNSGQCPQGSGITTAQMQACIDAQLDFAAQNYFFQSWYETFGGKPIVTFFLDETSWPSVDWNAVWVHEHAHVAQGQSCGAGCAYAAQVLLIGRNSGSIARTGLDGGFAWYPTQTYNNASPSTQFDWNGTAGYFDNFYSICRANPSRLCIGFLEKGFDDSNASFGTGKVMAQQCGQLPLFTAIKISAAGYSSSSQLPYVQLGTWNDYEEGTAGEDGIDPCLSLSASLVGANLNWTFTKLDATYSTVSTIDHLRVLSGSGTTFQTAIDNIPPALSGSVSLATLAPGTYMLQAVGKPMIFNINSNTVSNSQPAPAPVNGLFTKVSQVNQPLSLEWGQP